MRTYITTQGDTWDFIAMKMYPKLGAEKLMDILLDYNPDYIDIVIFPANVVLSVPEISEPVVSNLPAWKR
ncbi:MAG: tail protein X [Synergistaceae bacterium]|nr:tail protein X [Synergistaceae bacterium]MBR0315310.1 tail protein X [Synergistaceae bacterium]